MEPNPYSSPACVPTENVDATDSIVDSSGIVGTTKRRTALAIFSLPVLVAIPVRHWVFHIAGNWLVNNDIDPDERRMDLGLMYVLIMAAITGAAIFPGLFLLFIDNYLRPVTGCLMIPALVFFILAWLVFGSMADAYFRFS
jgi:hypothetical protein